ncbi:hypothetical protein Golomagni_04990 [Golovinomyces magnicellulatus]|nr:hypothetical protein Golomagni_04990 [Golovinomyces magnicellulatus]
MTTPSSSSPVSHNRLKQIANDACHLALGEAEYYEHSKTESWNTTIIVRHFHSLLSLHLPFFSKRKKYQTTFYLVLRERNTRNSILRALISESTSTPGGTPPFKFTVNSTIIQHLVPTSVIQRTKVAQESANSKSKDLDSSPTLTNSTKDSAIGTDGRPHVGRRGMHSATGAYWNEKTDGMWSFKYDGGDRRGLDVVISIVWIAL